MSEPETVRRRYTPATARSRAAQDARGAGRDISRPAPGYWLTRLTKNGVLVAAAIRRHHTTEEPGNPGNLMERSPFLAGYLDGAIVSPDVIWLKRLQPTTIEEYRRVLAVSAWAKEHAPDSPEADPRKAVDLRKVATF